jgi:hypothetical protein
MKSPAIENRKTLPNLLACLLLLLFEFGCAQKQSEPKSEQETVLATFKQTINDYLKSRKAPDSVFESFDDHTKSWKKMHHELDSESAKFDVKKTDSLVSPYVGVLEFVVHERQSPRYSSENSARQATEFPKTYNMQHRHTYSYQDGKWVLKSKECDAGMGWNPCGDYGED